MLDLLPTWAGHAAALLANGWTAYSLVATLVGGAGIGLVVLALVATAWLPGVIRQLLILGGAGLMILSAGLQAGQAKGAADAFALSSARAMAAEIRRTEAAEAINRELAAAATDAVAAEQADNRKLQEMNDALRHDPRLAGECLPRDLSRRLRRL